MSQLILEKGKCSLLIPWKSTIAKGLPDNHEQQVPTSFDNFALQGSKMVSNYNVKVRTNVGLLLNRGIQPVSNESQAAKATIVDERLSCQMGAEQRILSLASTVFL